MAQRIAADPAVEYAQPDVRVFPLAAPNDPQYTQQWHYMEPSTWPGGANLPPAWDITSGSAQMRVAVVDSGVVAHGDLDDDVADGSGKVLPGYDFVGLDIDPGGSCDGEPCTANDGDGRDADARDPGDWVTQEEANGTDSETGDFFEGCPVTGSTWHGTHVAGLVGALTNNAMGAAGVDWQARILPARVVGKCGGYISDVVDALRWAAGLSVPGVPDNPNPAHVVNISLGGSPGGVSPTACGDAEQSAVNDVRTAGKVIVVPAGNNNTDAASVTPASCEGVITVAAHDRQGQRASYSNFGALVEISAPGGDARVDSVILSLLNLGTTTPETSPAGDTYGRYQGTSQATPHVSGVAALMLDANQDRSGELLSPAVISAKLQATARAFQTGACDVGVDQCGAGLLDAHQALRSVTTAPTADAGSDMSADPGEQLTLDGSASTDDQWGSVSSYEWREADEGLTLTGMRPSFMVPTPAPVGKQFQFALTVTDDTNLDSENPDVTTITVNNVTPVIDPIGDKTFGVSTTAAFTVSASDGNGDAPQWSASGLPEGATFDAGTGRFSWPDVGPEGTYQVTFTAVDALDESRSDSETITITVTAASQGGGGGGGCSMSQGGRLDPVLLGLFLLACLYLYQRSRCAARGSTETPSSGRR